MSTALSTAVEALKAQYTASNPLSYAQHNSRLSHLPAGSTRSVLSYPPFPLCVHSAARVTLTSVDGAAYTDFLCEYSAGLFGHSHPVILAALRNALDHGLNFGAVNVLEGELAADLRARFEIDKIRFTNSATEASIMALAAATVHTGRKKVWLWSFPSPFFSFLHVGLVSRRRVMIGFACFAHGIVLDSRLLRRLPRRPTGLRRRCLSTTQHPARICNCAI